MRLLVAYGSAGFDGGTALDREWERRGVRVSVEEDGEVVETFDTTDETVDRST